MKVYSLWRCAGSAGVYLSVKSGKDTNERNSHHRVAHCIDNGPMEGFWGILNRERYYGRRFTNKRELIQMIERYIHYYNTLRVQRNLGVLTPMEKHDLFLAA